MTLEFFCCLVSKSRNTYLDIYARHNSSDMYLHITIYANWLVTGWPFVTNPLLPPKLCRVSLYDFMPTTAKSDKRGHTCPPSSATHPSDRWETLFVYSFICKFTNLRSKIEGLESPMEWVLFVTAFRVVGLMAVWAALCIVSKMLYCRKSLTPSSPTF